MQQRADQEFGGVTLAVLYGDKVAVCAGQPSAQGPRWSLPQADRQGAENPAECALRLLKSTLDLDLPVTRLNWPILAENEGPLRWFFTAWITPLEWDVLTRSGELRDTVMLSVSAFLEAPSIPEGQKTTLRSYLDQPRPRFGHG